MAILGCRSSASAVLWLAARGLAVCSFVALHRCCSLLLLLLLLLLNAVELTAAVAFLIFDLGQILPFCLAARWGAHLLCIGHKEQNSDKRNMCVMQGQDIFDRQELVLDQSFAALSPRLLPLYPHSHWPTLTVLQSSSRPFLYTCMHAMLTMHALPISPVHFYRTQTRLPSLLPTRGSRHPKGHTSGGLMLHKLLLCPPSHPFSL